MALTRRSGQRFEANIWPGFVDAMTALLLVLIFVLSVFMVVQFVLQQTITSQDDALDALNDQVATLADALGLERQRSADLQGELGALSSTLDEERAAAAAQAALIGRLQGDLAARDAELGDQETRISGLEARVAALLAARAEDADARTGLEQRLRAAEAENTELLTAQEALNLALARARDEIDAGAEAARLAAARRAALEAMIADLQAETGEQQASLADLAAALATKEAQVGTLSAGLDALRDQAQSGADRIDELERARLAEAAAAEALRARLSEAERALSAEETARLAEAAAAEALRERLADADAELTAMTLSLEAERQKAEDTLTLLAGAEAARRALQTDLEALRETAAASADARDAAADRTADLEAEIARLLAARDDAEDRATAAMTEAEARAQLLAQARSQLRDQSAKSNEDQRRLALLNQQMAALRTELRSLEGLLESAEAKDAEQRVEIETLGQRLNAALARAADEQRRRADLEAAERKRLEEEAKELSRYRSDFFGRLRDVLGDRPGVRIVGDRFAFDSEVLFPPGETELSASGRDSVGVVAGVIREAAAEIPNDIDWIIRVDGHTDDVPVRPDAAFRDNWDLSQARALSVVRYLIDDQGLPANRLAAAGFGEFQPVNPADTPEARAQNRRIELKLTER